MPLVNVALLKGKTPKYKKKVLDSIHQGLIDSIGIEDWDRFQRVTEYGPDDFMIIELKLFPGRTSEQKKDLIEKITDNLNQSLKIAPSDVFIVIEEPPLENWGMGGKQKC